MNRSNAKKTRHQYHQQRVKFKILDLEEVRDANTYRRSYPDHGPSSGGSLC
jgi:hypothetical protein